MKIHLSSALASVIPSFCIGLVSGAAGGLLLGATAVVVLQSLELLMNHLEKYITEGLFSGIQEHDVQISMLAVAFSDFFSTLSLSLGLCFGLSTYSWLIKTEALMAKVLHVAGMVFLMVVTASGYIPGLTLESFLSLTFNVDLFFRAIISLAVDCLFPLIRFSLKSYMFVLVCGMVYTPHVALVTYMLSFLFELKLILGGALAPAIIALKLLEKPRSLKLTSAPVPRMLIVCDVYSIAGYQISSSQSPASTYTKRVVLEAIFVGLLASLIWTVSVRISLFVLLQQCGAAKICASAAASCTAMMGVIELALFVFSPGPSIGTLMGIAAAAGVSLSAAGSAINQFGQASFDRCELMGNLGVTAGLLFYSMAQMCIMKVGTCHQQD